MSIIASRAVWNLSLPVSEKMVMLCLAEHHNKDTWRCDPSHETIAEMTGLSRRQVIRILDQLEGDKIIAIERNRGRNKSNNYQIAALKCDTAMSHFNEENVTKNVTFEAENVTSEPTKCDIAVSHEPIEPFKPFKPLVSESKRVSPAPKKSDTHSQQSAILRANKELARKLIWVCGYAGPEYVLSEKLTECEESVRILAGWQVTVPLLEEFARYWWGQSPPTFRQVVAEWGKYLTWRSKNGTNHKQSTTDERAARLAAERAELEREIAAVDRAGSVPDVSFPGG